MAEDLGLKAKLTRLDWSRLAGLGQAFPVLGLLKNGNGAIFSSLREADARP